MAKLSTRKMPCSLRKDGAASTRSEHLIPCLTKAGSVFVGVKSGKEYTTGCVSYLGCDISTDDILAKLNLSEKESKRARPVLDSYLIQLKEYKVGNVLSLSWTGGILKRLKLNKEFERPASRNKNTKLP